MPWRISLGVSWFPLDSSLQEVGETVWHGVCEVVVHSNVHNPEKGEGKVERGRVEDQASVEQPLTNWAVVVVLNVAQSAAA